MSEEDIATQLKEVKWLLFQVLHQRTGISGLKVEDILYQENEDLLLRCTKYTRDCV